VKLVAKIEKGGARTLVIDYDSTPPDKDSARLVEAAHKWLYDPTQRRLDEERDKKG
jgi:hypothetical protein